MGNDQFANDMRIKLEHEMDMMQARLKQVNEANKPPPPPPPSHDDSGPDWFERGMQVASLAVGAFSAFGWFTKYILFVKMQIYSLQ